MDELQMPALDPALLARAGARLEGFAAGLSRHGQAALQVLLTRAASADGQEIAPPAGLLEPQELAVYEQLRAEPPSAVDGGRAVLTVIMKATRLCNLRCTYCHSWKEGPGQVMGFPVLARAIRDVLGDPGVHYVDFVWHGGEATLLSPAFYSKALWLQERFRRSDQVVHNTIQTNGTHLTDAWLSFLRDHQIRVGVSLDGPPEIHDRRRLDAAGRPTAARVREGLRRLHAAGIPQVGILMVVDEEVCDLGAGPLLAYLLETGIKRVALLNVLPENSGTAIRPGSYLPLPR